MLSERAWAGDWWATLASTGLPAGVVFGLFNYGTTGSPSGAIVAGTFFGVLFGAWAAWGNRRRWPAGRPLSPADRLAAVRAVRAGATNVDARLAPAVEQFAAVMQRSADQNRRNLWFAALFAAAAVAFGIASALDDRWRETVTWAVVLAVGVGGTLRQLSQHGGVVAKARRAADAARHAASG